MLSLYVNAKRGANTFFQLLGSSMEIVFIYLSTYSITLTSKYTYYYMRKSISISLCNTHRQQLPFTSIISRSLGLSSYPDRRNRKGTQPRPLTTRSRSAVKQGKHILSDTEEGLCIVCLLCLVCLLCSVCSICMVCF